MIGVLPSCAEDVAEVPAETCDLIGGRLCDGGGSPEIDAARFTRSPGACRE